MPIEILMPALSPTMEEGSLTKWLVGEGDQVRSGDVLAEIETDKATMEVEAVEEGEVAKILVSAGTDGVKINTPIAVLLEEGEDARVLETLSSSASGGHTSSEAEDFRLPPRGGGGTGAKAGRTDRQAGDTEPGLRRNGRNREPDGRIKVSPLAKRLAKERGIDLANVKGSGPNSRIIKTDIENAKVKTQAAPTLIGTEIGMLRAGGAGYLERMGILPGTYNLEPLDGMRRVIATRMTESVQQVPHFPLTIDCEIDELLAMRKDLNAQAPEGVKISVNDMLIRASALALKQVPEANASYTPDGIAYHNHADVAVAVAIDGGLITPNVREAENKGLVIISTEMKDFAARARSRKLQPQEYQGGTFSLSNLGMMGIKSFGAIINQPQGMILSVGAGELRPVIRDGEISKATMMSVTLTCDHRVVDGAIGARWLAVFKRLVEKPVTMML